MPRPEEVTALLNAASAGDGDAPARLLELVYDDLRRLAAAYLKNESNAQTLQPTALVHDAFVRLADWQNVSWQSRAHFFAAAARVMRNVLVDNARSKRTRKRDFGHRVALSEVVSYPAERALDLLALEEALLSLEHVDERQARVVELKFFGGLTNKETAHVLGISETTVKNEWEFAKAWFQRELTRGS